MSIDLNTLSHAIERHGVVARVLIADHNGSAPRGTGTSMLVWSDGQSGTIGGGALEFAAVDAARDLISMGGTRMDRVPLGPALGQCCGGAVTLVTEVFEAVPKCEDVFARPLSGTKVPLSIQRMLRNMRNLSVPLQTVVMDDWVIEPVRQGEQPLWIYGAGHVGRALVDVLHDLPFAITWVDTSAERFPDVIPQGVSQLIAQKPEDVVAYSPPTGMHLILTYSHTLDLELCHRILAHGFRSAGLIGSATKWARFRKRLLALGHPLTEIDRIDCPIGDPRLGKEPKAIAVGVASALLNKQETHLGRAFL